MIIFLKHNKHTSLGNLAGTPFWGYQRTGCMGKQPSRVKKSKTVMELPGAENQEKGRQRQSSLLVMLILVRRILISVRFLERLQVITLLWYFSQRQVAVGFRKPFCCHPASSTGLAVALQNSHVATIFMTERAFQQGVKGKASEAWQKHTLCSVVPLGTFPEFRQVSMEPVDQSFYFHLWFVNFLY